MKLIILDRDGVINYDSPDYIKTPQEWRALPGSLNAIATLNRTQHLVVVATNQSGVARGRYSLDTLEKIHQTMQDQLAEVGGHLDGIYFCPHSPEDECECRKPKPGLLLQIAKDFSIDLTHDAITVGDSLRDIQAAQAVGCPAALVKTGNGKSTLQQASVYLENIGIYDDLAQFVTEIIALKG